MREIDTEAPVVWPAWCYSANTQESAIDVISRKGDLASDPRPATSPSSYVQQSTTATTILPASTTGSRNRSRRKNTYTTSLSNSTTASYNNGSSPPSTKPITNSPPSPSLANRLASENLQQHLQLSSFLINKKMLSERILRGFGSSSAALETSSSNNNNQNQNSNNSAANSSSNKSNSNNNNNGNSNSNINSSSSTNSSSNSKKNCDNSTISVYDRIKNEAQMMMDGTSVDSHLKNGDLNATRKESGGSGGSGSGGTTGSVNLTTTSVKKERLSPTAINGDVQSSISRSRSATPSSFPGTPPQATHPSDLNTQNILNQSRNNEFPTRNYSDFMRSLAAKYNNSNTNESSPGRNLFFDNQKYPSASSKATNKESPSPPEIKRPSLTTPPQVPFVPPLFPGLPFSTNVFPPLIDMSSTQALVTLARAAKEAELQNILRNAQKRPGSTSSTNRSLSPSIRAVLAAAPQLAQFSTSSFMVPPQFPPAHRSPTGPSSTRNSQSPQQYRGEPTTSSSSTGPPATNSASSGSSTSTIVPKRSSSPPLDLSSSQQSKRLKTESTTSSPATSPPVSNTASSKSITPDQQRTNKDSLKTSVVKAKTPESSAASTAPSSAEFPRHCRSQSDEISTWTVDDVCSFVSSIDICSEYTQKFRDQCIDGSGLPLLTEDHLTNSLGMKLGPALKLRSVLAKRLGGPCPCVSCTTLLQQQQQQQQQQQLILQQHHQPALMHLTPPQTATSSATPAVASSSPSPASQSGSLSSSSSLSSCASSASIASAAISMTANPNVINNVNSSASNLKTTTTPTAAVDATVASTPSMPSPNASTATASCDQQPQQQCKQISDAVDSGS